MACWLVAGRSRRPAARMPVPLGLFTAIAVVRRLAVGYLLGMVILVKGASMALAISAMLLVEWQVTDELALPPLIDFASMAVSAP
jgi:hypothetical protein